DEIGSLAEHRQAPHVGHPHPHAMAARPAPGALCHGRGEAHAVTSNPRRTSGMKLFPVPQATSRARLPASPWARARSSKSPSQRS
ncbi:MAG: hypothetical protein QOI45_1466, partial [Thermoleophilaceae bacterium]|nr:hypothetical protein [Thermoleophilaceae bacterium]